MQITYSPAYTIVPTYECFNHCSYCNFRVDPGTDNWITIDRATHGCLSPVVELVDFGKRSRDRSSAWEGAMDDGHGTQRGSSGENHREPAIGTGIFAEISRFTCARTVC